MKFLLEKLKGLSQSNVFDFLMMICVLFNLFFEEKIKIEKKDFPYLFVLSFLSLNAGMILKSFSYRLEYAKRWLELVGGWHRETGRTRETPDGLPYEKQFNYIPIELEDYYNIRSLCTFGFVLYPVIGMVGTIVFSARPETNIFGPKWAVELICTGIFIFGISMLFVANHWFFGTIKENEFIKLQKSKLTHWSVNLFATVCLFFSAIAFQGIFDSLVFNFFDNKIVNFEADRPPLILDIILRIFGTISQLLIYGVSIFFLYLPPRVPLVIEDFMSFYFTARSSLLFRVEDIQVEDRKRVFWMWVSFSLVFVPYLIQTFIVMWGSFFGLSP